MFKKYYIIVLLLLVSIVNISVVPNVFASTNNNVAIKLSKNGKTTEKYKGINKLMIVAHPDDESFWGGAHLLEDKYLVVCVTCGTDKKRVEEFKKAMSITKDKYIMLGYPDLTNGKKDDWSKVYGKIEKDLNKIIHYKNWKMIVTHNPSGEYGHIHHKMTSNIVTKYASKDILYYFGYYVSKENIGKLKGTPTISSNSKNIKMNKLIPVYASQKHPRKVYKHMFNYENFVFNKNWNPESLYKQKFSYGRVAHTDGIYLRKSPVIKNNIIKKLSYNDIFKIKNIYSKSSKNCRAGWYYVEFANKSGYICGKNISKSNTIALTKKVLIKNGPSNKHKTYKKITKDSILILKSTKKLYGKGCKQGYYKINMDGKSRYVCSSSITKIIKKGIVYSNSKKSVLLKNNKGNNISNKRIFYKQGLSLYNDKKYQMKNCSSGYYKVIYGNNIGYMCSSIATRNA